MNIDRLKEVLAATEQAEEAYQYAKWDNPKSTAEERVNTEYRWRNSLYQLYQAVRDELKEANDAG